MAAHRLLAKEPGSFTDKTEHYFLFGTWVPSGKLVDWLIKYIKFNMDKDWNELPPGETACYLTNMKKLIKDFKVAEKQVAHDGTEVPDHIQQSMLWDVDEDSEGEEDGSMAESENLEGLEEDGSMAGLEDLKHLEEEMAHWLGQKIRKMKTWTRSRRLVCQCCPNL